MKQLVIFPRGQLSAKDKERMSKEGYLAVEADDPSKVSQPSQSLNLPPDKVLLCALKSMGALHPKETFTNLFTELLEESTKQTE